VVQPAANNKIAAIPANLAITKMFRVETLENDNVRGARRFPYPALNLANALSVSRPTQARWISRL